MKLESDLASRLYQFWNIELQFDNFEMTGELLVLGLAIFYDAILENLASEV
jgi:hypothetical protein